MNLHKKVQNFQVTLRKKKLKEKINELRKKFIDNTNKNYQPANYIQNFLFNHSQKLENALNQNDMDQFLIILKQIHKYIAQFSSSDPSLDNFCEDFLNSSLFDIIIDYLQKVNLSNQQIEYFIFAILSNLTAGPAQITSFFLKRNILCLLQCHLDKQQDIDVIKRILATICNLVQEKQGCVELYKNKELIDVLNKIYNNYHQSIIIQECFVWLFDGIFQLEKSFSTTLELIFINLLKQLSSQIEMKNKTDQTMIEISRAIYRYLQNNNFGSQRNKIEKILSTNIQNNFFYLIDKNKEKQTLILLKAILLLTKEDEQIFNLFYSENLKDKILQSLKYQSKCIFNNAVCCLSNFMLNDPQCLQQKDITYIITICLENALTNVYESTGINALGFIRNFLLFNEYNYELINQMEFTFDMLDIFLKIIQRKKQRLTCLSLDCISCILLVGQNQFLNNPNLLALRFFQNEKHEIIYDKNYIQTNQAQMQSNNIVREFLDPQNQYRMIIDNNQLQQKLYLTMKKYSNQITTQYPTLQELIKFYSFDQFNYIQTQVAKSIFQNNHNLLISSPTGSGKTVLFEFCMFQLLGLNLDYRNKILIYISPLKAICQEVIFKWQQKFKNVNPYFILQEITSDNEKLILNQNTLEKNDQENLITEGLVIATPEKLNNILRKWKQHEQFLERISLVMIDEIHTIDDESRGVVLESMITRLKFLSDLEYFKQNQISKMRLIALSASLKNEEDFCHWLKVPKCNYFKFGQEFRPVQLQKKVLGYYQKSNDFMFDVSLNYKLTSVIQKYSQQKPVLVFVSTQKSTIKTCKDLIQINDERYFVNDENHFQILLRLSSQAINIDLKFCILNGLGFHNGSLQLQDRQLIENAFKNHHIRILITTSTLAMGVNLPAYMVVIKGTKGYKGQPKGYVQYDYHEIQQMMGRAGRPQFEKEGIVIVMTNRQNVARIEDFLNNQYKGRNIQSNFQEMLTDNLNNEIALRTVKNWEEALVFMKNSLYYSIQYINKELNLDEKILKQIRESFDLLKKNEFITQDKSEKGYVNSTILGFEAARQNFCIKSFMNFKKMFPQTFEGILDCLSQSYEFDMFRSSQKQRKELAELNKQNHFIIKRKSIKNYNQKIYVLLQSIWSRQPIKDWELKMQLTQIKKQAISILFFYRKFYQYKNCFRQKITCIKMIKYLKQKNYIKNKFAMLYDNEKITRNLLVQMQKKDIVCLNDFILYKDEFYKRFSNFQKKLLDDVLNFELKKPTYQWNLENNQNNKFDLHIHNKSTSTQEKHLSTFYAIYNQKTNKVIKSGYFFQQNYSITIRNQLPYQLQIYLINNYFISGDIEFKDLVKPFKNLNKINTEVIQKIEKTIKKNKNIDNTNIEEPKNMNTTKIKLIQNTQNKNPKQQKYFKKIEENTEIRQFKPMDILRQRRQALYKKINYKKQNNNNQNNQFTKDFFILLLQIYRYKIKFF